MQRPSSPDWLHEPNPRPVPNASVRNRTVGERVRVTLSGISTGTRLAEQHPVRGKPMSVVRMKDEKGDRPVTGSGMDRVVETRRMTRRTKIALGVAGLLIIL